MQYIMILFSDSKLVITSRAKHESTNNRVIAVF